MRISDWSSDVCSSDLRPAPAGRPARCAGSPGGGAMSDRVHVVVVDDERDIRETVAEYLELNGYKVSKAEGGAALRRIVEQGRVDLAVLDVTMPGEEIGRATRRNSSH